MKSKRKIKTPNSQTLPIVVFAARTPRTCFPQPNTTIPTNPPTHTPRRRNRAPRTEVALVSLLMRSLHSKIHGVGVLWLGKFAHSHCLFLCCLLGAAGRLLFPIIGSHFDSSMYGVAALFVSKCRRRGGGSTHATNIMITFHW